MGSAYSWVRFLHIGAVLAMLALHGPAIVVTLAVRRQQGEGRLATMMELTDQVRNGFYGSFAVLILSGVALGFMGGWWGHGWIWAAIVVLIAVGAVMGLFGTNRFGRLRAALGVRGFGDGSSPPDSAAVATAVASQRPLTLTVSGVVSIVLLLWLMVFKPF